MTRDEFTENLKRLRASFPKERFTSTGYEFDVWYSHFAKYTKEEIDRAIDRHCEHSKFPPTIADLVEAHRQNVSDRKRVYADIRDCYDAMVSRLNDHTTSEEEGYTAFLNLIESGDADLDKRKSRAMWIRDHSTGRTETIIEYLKWVNEGGRNLGRS